MEVWHTIQVLKRQGRSRKSIARELGISKNTVKRYWEGDARLNYQREKREKQLDQHCEQIQSMVGKGFIGTRILKELRTLGYGGSLASVYRFVNALRDEAKQEARATIRFETQPGKQMQYDWKEWMVCVGGRPLKVYFHQAILSHSRYKYLTFSLDITTDTIIRVLIQALAAFGGAPEEIVIDNPRQMVLSNRRSESIRYQDDFLVFLGTYGMKPDPCMTYRARTKGKVENPFYYLQEHFLRGLEVSDFTELDARLKAFTIDYNNRLHSKTGKAPSILWPEEPLRVLARPVSFAFRRESRKVSWDGYVHVDSNRYPVSLGHAGKKVWVEKVMGLKLHILDAALIPIAEFDLVQEKGITLPHPEHERLEREFLDKKMRRRSRAKVRFLEAFPDPGEAFVQLAENRCGENAGYHLQKITELTGIYEDSAVLEALRECMHLGAPTIDSVQALIKEDLRKPAKPLKPDVPALPPVLRRPLSEYRALYGGGTP